MNSRKIPAIPPRLEAARRRLEQWRRTRTGRARIPESLWMSAAKLAGRYGLCRTARTLRLDYYALKKRVGSAELHGSPAPMTTTPPRSSRVPPQFATASPTLSTAAPEFSTNSSESGTAFVELVPVRPGGGRPLRQAGQPECTIELERPGGAKMRIHLAGIERPDLAALSRSFWEQRT